MRTQERWFLEQTFKNLGALCLQYLRGEIRRSEVRKHFQVHFLVGRTYQEVAWLYWHDGTCPPEVRQDSESRTELRQDNGSRSKLWRTWGEPLTDLLRQCWDFELSARRAKTLSNRLWNPLARYWSQRCQTAGRSFGSALRAWSSQGKQTGETGSPCEENPSQPEPEDVTFAEEGELTAEDVLTLALDDLLTTTILGDYVWQVVKPLLLRAEPLPFPSGWLWLRRPYGNVIRRQLLEDARWRTLWSNWLGLGKCLLAELDALGLVLERIRKLPADKQEHLAELARNVAERSGLRLASLTWDRPLEKLFFRAVGQAGD
jgi:hypothetical protein